LERTNARLVASVPAESVRVPLMVWSALTLSAEIPVVVRPVTDRLLKVLLVDKVCVEPLVLVKLTLLKVCEPPAKVALAFVSTMLDVPALNVRFVFVMKLTAPDDALNVTVELPKLIVRVLLLLDDRDVAVTLKLLVVSVPLVTVIEPEDVKASLNVQVAVEMPVNPKPVAPSVFPEVVIVNDPEAARKSREPV
jgi:hypothetical protein